MFGGLAEQFFGLHIDADWFRRVIEVLGLTPNRMEKIRVLPAGLACEVIPNETLNRVLECRNFGFLIEFGSDSFENLEALHEIFLVFLWVAAFYGKSEEACLCCCSCGDAKRNSIRAAYCKYLKPVLLF